jgi:HAMP domain-containing protein
VGVLVSVNQIACRPSALWWVPQAAARLAMRPSPRPWGRGPAVPAPGLGEVRFEGAGTAVGDGDGERGLVDVDAQLELGARVQHGVLGELAGQEHRGVGDFGVEAADGVEHLLQHPAGLPGRPRVGWQTDPPMQQGRHGCSVPGAARSRLRCLPPARRGGGHRAGHPGDPVHYAGEPVSGVEQLAGGPWRPRGEAETVTTARKARLDPADHHAAAVPAEALLAELTDALAQLRRGRFDVRLPRREGAAGALADQFNDMAAVAQRHNRDLLRIGRSVGREGRMGDRLDEESYDGSWGDGARAVNALIDDLAAPTAEIARVIEAVAEGDLSQHMALEIEGRPLRGEYRRIGRTVNTMVDQLSSFADEVTRVAREVGTDGRLGGQADVRGVAGTWRALTDSVNTMASNLTNQVRSISDAATAIARGDLSRTITVNARGEVAELADTINALTATLRLFADEVTRVAREVGTEGLLGGQAAVPGVAGTWKDLTDAVNVMAANLTAQVRGIAAVATAVERGDLSQKISVDAQGEILELKSTVNKMVDQLGSFADEVTRVAREVGTDGRLGGQAVVPNAAGTWRDLTVNVNELASNLTMQVRNIAQVTTAVARGDLSQKITVEARGEILELKSTVNTMVDQLGSFADEVTRVAREVGIEGKLGGQAQVRGVSGTWRDLTVNVNELASNLTGQVRNIAQVTTAVARGDLSQKITVDARGEILELKSTVNTMVDQLGSFADEVTRVAREVGTEGELGGQAQVRGVSGTWRDLTENVNRLALTLTSQLRAISGVATSVASGDLTQEIRVAAAGEIADLKDNINRMIATLRETTAENAQQNWLDSNLARIGEQLQGQRDLGEVCQLIMNEVSPLVDAQVGAFFLASLPDPARRYVMVGGYSQAVAEPPSAFTAGEGLVGQAAASRRVMHVRDVPEGYLKIRSAPGRPHRARSSCCPCCSRASASGSSSWARSRRSRCCTSRSSAGSSTRSASRWPPSRPTGAPRSCSRRASGSPPSCRTSRPSCSGPTPSWRRRPSSCPGRTATSRSRTSSSTLPGAAWRRRRSSSPRRASTRPSSWPT